MKKSTFADMINSTTAKTVEAAPKYTAQDHRERLLRNVMKQIEEGGSQEAICKLIFGEESKKAKFIEAVEKFIAQLPEDVLPNTRVYVTSDKACNFRINGLGKMSICSTYTIVLEKDQNRDEDEARVIRVILNTEDQGLRLKEFFTTLDFQGLSYKTLDGILSHMDDKGGITVQQMLIGDFQAKYGQRKDWFKFADDCYAIYDEGKLILTHTRWKRSVSLKMPANGSRPWLYHFEKKDDGSRPTADFRVNLYGALWHQAKWT